MATPIKSGNGEIPSSAAVAVATGLITSAAEVLEMHCVTAVVTMNKPANAARGPAAPLNWTTWSPIRAATPYTLSASHRQCVPWCAKSEKRHKACSRHRHRPRFRRAPTLRNKEYEQCQDGQYRHRPM